MAGQAAGGICVRHLSTGLVAILKLQTGDELIASIEAAMREGHLQSAIVQFGIGSLASAEFGVLPEKGPHARQRVRGPVELVHLGGLVVGTGSGGPYRSHLHIALAPADGVLRGGHLFEATVGLVAEVGLTPVHDSRLRRVRDEERHVDMLEF